MKAYIIGLLCLVALQGAGQNIPDFTLVDTDGQTHHLYDYLQKKQAVVIDFFLESCGNCGPAAALLEQVYQDYGQNQGWIKVLGMECDTASPAEVDAWMSANGATYPAIAGPDARSYWVTNWQPLLGGQFNQCIGIFPTAFTSPQTCYLDFIHIGLMTATQQQDLIDKLHQYGFYAGLDKVPEGNAALFIYPNPVGETLLTGIAGYEGEAGYRILDVSGRELQAGPYSSRIDIPELGPGLYLLVIQADGRSLSQRFVKP